MGDYYTRNGGAPGGQFAKAAVSYFKFILKGDRKAKDDLFNDKGLKARGWEVEFKNWPGQGKGATPPGRD